MEVWEHQQLSRTEIDKMREDVQLSSEQLDEARRKLIETEERAEDKSKK